jgi:hypothetical protein
LLPVAHARTASLEKKFDAALESSLINSLHVTVRVCLVPLMLE